MVYFATVNNNARGNYPDRGKFNIAQGLQNENL